MNPKIFSFPLATGSIFRLRSCNPFIDDLVERYAWVCSIEANEIVPTACELQCEVYLVDEIERLRKKYPEYIETGRKTYFRILFSPDYKKSLVFYNREHLENENLRYLSVQHIDRALQIQVLKNFAAAPCHCALLEINGCGAVIGAVGDCGKTTCATRLPSPHRALADDYALVFEHEGKLLAQAMPTWSNFINGNREYRADCSLTTEVDSFFFLKQSQEDFVEPVNGVMALQHLNNNFQDLVALRTFTDMPEDFAENIRLKIFNFADRLTRVRPTYMLYATLHGNFWKNMDNVMKNHARAHEKNLGI